MRFKRRLSVLTGILGVIIFTILPTTPVAFGEQSDAVSPQPTEVDGHLIDAQLYAADQGVTVDEALRRLQLMDAARPLGSELTNEQADTYGGGWYEHSPEFKLVLQFTKDGDRTILPYLEKHGELASIIEIRTAKMSEKDLMLLQSQVMQDIREAGIEAYTESNIREARVRVYVEDGSRSHDALLNGEVPLPENADVIAFNSAVEGQAAEGPSGLVADAGNYITGGPLYGGHPISRYYGYGPPYATTGFSAYLNGNPNNRGVLTAGHVPFNWGYGEVYYDLNYALQYVNHRVGTDRHDCAFYAPGFPYRTPTNRFWDGYSLREVTAVELWADMFAGEYVFKYGIETGHTFGQIVNKYYQGRFVRVHNSNNWNLSGPGDSGGPWFRNTVAIGLHKTSPPDNPNDAIFMAVEYVNGINATVLTVP